MSRHTEDQAPINGVRADVWIWAARFFKSRTLVKEAIEGGKIEVNSAHCKPAKMLRVGDRVKITRGQERIECIVLALSENRGPAPVAQQLYEETAASVAARESARDMRRLLGPVPASPGRPTKKARRQIRGFREALDSF